MRTTKQYFSKFHESYIMLNMIYMLFLVKQERVNRQKALLNRHNIIILFRQMCTYVFRCTAHHLKCSIVAQNVLTDIWGLRNLKLRKLSPRHCKCNII